MIIEVEVVPLAAGWGLRLHDDGTLELTREIDGDMFVMELGECHLDQKVHKLEEGVNFLRSAGSSVHPPI